MVRVFKLHNFDIFVDQNDEYIIYNTLKSFPDGHVHLKNFHTAKYIVKLADQKQIPTDAKSKYIINCLIQISTDDSYIHRLTNFHRRMHKY